MTINIKNFLNDKTKLSKMGEFQSLKQIKGLEMSAISADLYKDGRDDLALFYFSKGANYATLTTTNSITSEFIPWNSNSHKKIIKGLLVNTKNANTFTGKQGKESIDILAKNLSRVLTLKESKNKKGTSETVKIKDLIFASTGVIGGLFIIGTERHESRRIDNQLRGRSGRQGDPGGTIFFISLQDELMRIFGGDSIDGMLQKLGLKENESIDHPWINKAMERAQKKVEARNFDIRKTLIKFDDVMNDQRQVIFSQRLKILKDDNINEVLKDFFDEILINLNLVRANFQKSGDEKSYLTEIKNITGNIVNDKDILEFGKLKETDFNKQIQKLYSEKKNSRVKILGENQNNNLEKKIFLQIIDFSWRSHLQYLEQLRQVIGLRQYGQKDPLSEFKKEAFVLFEGLLLKIKNDLIKFLLNLNIVVSNEEKNENNRQEIKDIKSEKKVGRNEKCPCGSGKKFKHCHGNI
jgi:preprotein translocase subunit SecA